MLTSQQKRLCSYFEKAAKTKTLRHSYIIKGESGSGKKYVLNNILKIIMCRDHSACDKCNGCNTVSSGANPDIIRVSNGNKKTIEIQKIREQIIKEAYIKPVLGEYKIFVIENAHLMDSAPQNALLKLIEEPPSYAVFILLCDNLSAILPTIVSRVMLLELTPTSVIELKQICPLNSGDEFMYNYCLGNIGSLKSLCEDDEFRDLRDGVINSFIKYVKSDSYGVYDITDFWNNNKDRKEVLINVLTLFLRDVVYWKNNLKDNITNTDKLKEIEAVSALITFKKSVDMFEAACNLPAQLGKYGNLNMVVHTMFIRLKEEIND